jgi:signal transduction histidine kinase
VTAGVRPDQVRLDVESLMQVQAAAKGIRVRRAGHGIPQCIRSDPLRFKQILVNLLRC